MRLGHLSTWKSHRCTTTRQQCICPCFLGPHWSGEHRMLLYFHFTKSRPHSCDTRKHRLLHKNNAPLHPRTFAVHLCSQVKLECLTTRFFCCQIHCRHLRSFRWSRRSIVSFCHSDSQWYTHFRFAVIFRLSSDWIWLHVYYDQILFVNASLSCSLRFSTNVDLCTQSWYCQGWRWPEGWSAQGQGCTSHLERSWTYYG